MPTRRQRELDACGIGFVADAEGRASRSILDAALTGLACVKHRGAVAADALTSDGTGILTTLPTSIFGSGNGVATLFVRGTDPRRAVEQALADEDLRLVEWRKPPTEPSALGDLAAQSAPEIIQAVFAPQQAEGPADEASAYRLRRRIQAGTEGTYVASCSWMTVLYKGLVAADRLADYFLDLADPEFAVHFAIFHQRFSTNTTPTWERAQPFRMLCHNGEINTVEGNENRMRARANLGTADVGLGPEDLFRPVIDADNSDSGMLDEAAELLTRGGRNVNHAMAMLIPEAWEGTRDLDPEVRGFYEYHSTLMEPWDGPAAVIYTDGVGVGALLDRNGLRPLRYSICEDGLVVCASEAGVVDLAGHGTVERGRLGPGHMLWVSPEHGLVRSRDLKDGLAGLAPFARWASEGLYHVGLGNPVESHPDDLVVRQASHGYTKEELAMVIKPMAAEGYEPTFSMGDDSPLAPMAGRARPVHHFLKQRFAQVTNPPIDPLRERLVMSLRTMLGPRAPLLAQSPAASRLFVLDSFFLYPDAVAALRRSDINPFPTVALDATFPVAAGPEGLERAVRDLAEQASAAVEGGAGVLVIDDGKVTPTRAPVPTLLACGAVHHALIEEQARSNTSIVVVADDARDVHHVAALLGFGADAVCPRLALQTVAAEADADDSESVVSPEAQDRFRAACEAGVLKIMSKMGISTVESYRGAQIFEVLGLDRSVVDVCFDGTPSPVGGLGWLELGEDVLGRHAQAFPADELDVQLESPGYVRVRKGGEAHGKSKEVVDALNALTAVAEPVGDGPTEEMVAAHVLQRAIRGESYEAYETFARMVNDRAPLELQDLLEVRPLPTGPIGLDEVEPAAEIAKRFSTGAMSHGALSKEAHETLAQAMNLIGGQSNCGEGGEDPYRFRTRGTGRDDKNSRIKQVASGRFGVTPEYLAFADEIQIKMAQGSKPGEGGQLPGHKVSQEIAMLRYTQPGVGLISPPPHHDIYSIEDLAQLIYDLKQVNGAQVSVKLVSTNNVGTVAAGVVKALADVVHISGHNGGTGASPLSSIKHAGGPWELGIADTQRALIDNHLRSRARIRVDGGFMTGRHVLLAALLGADEFSFGTSAMIAEGCIMLRACHRDTCKPGVATQRPNLRANFTGTPEGVAAYLMFVAEEVRRLLAQMGARSLEEVIGLVEQLSQRRTGDPRIDSFDLSCLLEPPSAIDGPRRFIERVELQDPRSNLGDRLLADAFRGIWDGDEVVLDYEITTESRSIGAALSGAIALEYGMAPPQGTAMVSFRGAAGQSFGAFLTHGVEFDLVGEANDYVGKGMGGGRIVIRPPANDLLAARGTSRGSSTVLAGNTCLYGATGGELFVAGAVGERFAVRNSGALAIVEAVGDHCCEYMTGGTVVVLGRIGHNLGAGMTGGEAFLWDPVPDRVTTRVNHDLVEVLRPDHDALGDLRWLVERHVELTGSVRGIELLESWDETVDHLWHILPRDRVQRISSTAASRVSAA